MPIRDEAEADHAEVGRLHRLAFGGDAEARLADALRRSGAAAVSLVAACGGGIVGHVPSCSAGSSPRRACSPWRPWRRCRTASGGASVRRWPAREGGWTAAFVLGEPAYHGRFGFSADAARGYTSPYAGEHFMAVRLGTEALPGAGAVVYPEPFAALS